MSIGSSIPLKGQKRFCRPCISYERSVYAIRTKTEIRQVTCVVGAVSNNSPAYFAEKMKTKIDSVIGQAIYEKRIATAEPSFAHIRYKMGAGSLLSEREKEDQ